MPYSIQHINTIVSGALLGRSQNSEAIEQLALDSRKIIFPTQSLFFAIVGKRHNGHHFLAQAYANGIRYFVVSESVVLEDFPEAQFIQVPNTLRALQQLAQYHRAQFNLQTIGITGSNGKTIVKEWLFQLLREDLHSAFFHRSEAQSHPDNRMFAESSLETLLPQTSTLLNHQRGKSAGRWSA